MPVAQNHTHIFKELFAEMLANNGRFNMLSPAKRKPFTAYVYTSVPKFFVSDGNHFVTTYFTKSCIADFNKKYPKIGLTDLHGKFITITSWSLNLIDVDSENNPLSYLNMEIQLVIDELKPNFSSKMTCNSFLVNIYKDNDVKLDFAIYRHFRSKETATNTFDQELPEYEDLEESKRTTNRHNKWRLEQEELSPQVDDLYDYDELVKKEIPELSTIQKEEVIEYMKNEYSSQYAGSKAKLENKNKMREEPPLRLQTPDDIKKAIENIIKFQKKPEVKDIKNSKFKPMQAPPPVTKKAEVKAARKKPMTITKFQEYIGWYEKQSNSGKFSSMSKGSLKKPTPALGRR
ncbi:unnamed protein product [Moneuplotes crassus]|uniref:Uncharacterized protein n=1 Tax=Euplotes crassus TaxID=5936 RepID=A0AAD1XHS7_EUPCR|nr:unnamed protein product [Moneuplotes crassus]